MTYTVPAVDSMGVYIVANAYTERRVCLQWFVVVYFTIQILPCGCMTRTRIANYGGVGIRSFGIANTARSCTACEMPALRRRKQSDTIKPTTRMYNMTKIQTTRFSSSRILSNRQSLPVLGTVNNISSGTLVFLLRCRHRGGKGLTTTKGMHKKIRFYSSHSTQVGNIESNVVGAEDFNSKTSSSPINADGGGGEVRSWTCSPCDY